MMRAQFWTYGSSGASVRLAVRKLCNRLRQILVAFHHIDLLRISRCLLPIPAFYCVQISGLQGKTAKHRVDVGEETILPLLFKARAQKLQRMPRVVRFMMLGNVLVTDNGGSEISLLRSRRDKVGNVSVSVSTFRCGSVMSSHARRLRACFPAASCFPHCWENSRSSRYQRSEPS